jgi:hypothetical protein
VLPQIEMGLDAKIRFAEGNKDGHSKNGVGVEIVDDNFIVIAKFA